MLISGGDLGGLISNPYLASCDGGELTIQRHNRVPPRVFGGGLPAHIGVAVLTPGLLTRGGGELIILLHGRTPARTSGGGVCVGIGDVVASRFVGGCPGGPITILVPVADGIIDGGRVATPLSRLWACLIVDGGRWAEANRRRRRGCGITATVVHSQVVITMRCGHRRIR